MLETCRGRYFILNLIKKVYFFGFVILSINSLLTYNFRRFSKIGKSD
jgi:hypothetical protein